MIDDKSKIGGVDISDEIMKRRSTRDSDSSSEGFSANHDTNNMRRQELATEMGIHTTEQNQIKEISYCRVCLQCEEKDNKLLKSCSCRDPIHQKCLVQWIEHRAETTNANSSMSCQICKGQYNVEIQSSFTLTFEICKEKNDKYWKHFLQSLAGFLLFFGMSVAGGIFLTKIQLDEDFSKVFQANLNLPRSTIVALMVMFLIFFGSFTIVLGYKLIIEYCYGTSFRIRPKNADQQVS